MASVTWPWETGHSDPPIFGEGMLEMILLPKAKKKVFSVANIDGRAWPERRSEGGGVTGPFASRDGARVTEATYEAEAGGRLVIRIMEASIRGKKPVSSRTIVNVIYKGFHLVFAQLQAGPACKPSKKTATAVHRVAPGHARRPASPTGAWPGLYPMKSKLTEQAAVV